MRAYNNDFGRGIYVSGLAIVILVLMYFAGTLNELFWRKARSFCAFYIAALGTPLSAPMIIGNLPELKLVDLADYAYFGGVVMVACLGIVILLAVYLAATLNEVFGSQPTGHLGTILNGKTPSGWRCWCLGNIRLTLGGHKNENPPQIYCLDTHIIADCPAGVKFCLTGMGLEAVLVDD